MVLQNKKIAIVGGGPGGLTLARLLQLKGLNVKVYERDFSPNARVQGSPLDMHETSGWAALQEAGLTEVFERNVREGADKKIIVDEQATPFFSDHEKDLAKVSNPKEIDRGTLRNIFLEALQPSTVLWDAQFISMEAQDEGWLLHFRNGSTTYADLVIAADGAHSKIRKYVTDIQAFYTGVTMVEITVEHAAISIPQIHKLLNGGKIMAFGHVKNILGGQKGKDALGFYLSFKPDKNWGSISGLDFSDRAQLLAWFKQEYNGWSPLWDQLIEKATLPLIPRPIYCMPLNQTWEALPNLTLMGDAAHVMPPFAGEGANTAMFDALELSQCLTSDRFDTLHEAISAYEIGMRARAALAAKQSLDNGDKMHSDGALEKMLKAFGRGKM